ncbi:glycosyltransferase family 4 protein [Agromyces sp. H66]|uniref:glycosyltransferase n=1 Tax=Agromyces sp. H66 TaxID=2529859 RepID=UPI0010AB29DC|nr:glycosyltransferase family 4 protein [Agromyces sp. H66]
MSPSLRGIAGRLAARLPEPVQMRLNPRKYGFRETDVPAPVQAPDTPIRLYIAPVNFAGQGYEWARAAERVPGVGAVDMQYRNADDLGFPSDYALPTIVFSRSRRWQRAQFEAVARGFTHVIIEAERPIFGTLFDGDVDLEVAALRDHGVSVAMLSHGSDLRLPSRHRQIDRWSPFVDEDWDLVDILEEQSAGHLRLLGRLGAPVFVSTPDLLLDWPTATWLPLVVPPEPWRGGPEPLARDVPIVVHAPSNARIKGSALIDGTMQSLHDRGLVEYRRIERVTASEMPALYRDADVVLEQFRIGTYSRAAVEAMCAGRVVVAHVHDQVREHVRTATGLDAPVVEATPDSLERLIRDLLDRRAHYREVARAGVEFAAAVHDGRLSAEVLRPFLLGDAR